MNRLLTLALIGLAGLLASCGSSVNSSTQAATNYAYLMVLSPTQFTLNAGDWTTISASVDVTFENGAPKAVSPPPTIKYFSSDSRVTISPAGEVCAGQWDTLYHVCTPSQPNLPTGYVTITAFDATRNVSATSQLSVHQRAANIGLSADVTPINRAAWPGSSQPWNPGGVVPNSNCISQNNQVQYVANPVSGAVDASGKPIPITSCSLVETAGCVNNNDYTWSVADSNVAQVSSYGFVVARNPGVTSVYATLNGTVSVPATFVTCPPSSITLGSSPFTSVTPLPPFAGASTADLDTLNKDAQEYLTAAMIDANGNALVTPPLNYISSDPLTGSFTTVLPLISKLTANTSGRFSVIAACEPTNCNKGVPDFALPLNPATCSALPAPGCVVSGTTAGFGYPIYSNVIGVSVQGISGSSVLVTGTAFAYDGVTPIHRLEVFDSESMLSTQPQGVELANVPNSLVVAPNGATAYVGDACPSLSNCAGLVVVNLTTYQSSLARETYPIVGGLSTDVVTGKVLGVSPDSRYVVLSDGTYVFLIDTTGTKTATRYSIPNIDAVTFASDDFNMWIGGTGGVYVFNADTFVPISSNTPADLGVSTNVTALAWMPDGQSYFASGSALTNYSTCNDQSPQTPTTNNFPTSVPDGLSTTALQGVPHLLGLDGIEWFDYSITTSAQIGSATPNGNVCKTIPVTINTPATLTMAASTSLPSTCPANQVTFSPRVEAEFVTGVVNTYGPGFVPPPPAPLPASSCAIPQPFIHGYSVAIPATTTVPAIPAAELTLPTLNATPIIPLSGGVLSDGRKLFVGSYDQTTFTATLHRFDLSTGSATTGPLLDGLLAEDLSISVDLVPSFVAVVPK
jgi:hypothetical protein